MNRKIAIATALLTLGLIAPARAAYDPLGAGTTKLSLDKRFASFLAKNDLKLVASQGAKRKGKKILLPVSGGRIDPTTGKGEVDHQGTLFFESARRRLPLRAITVKTKHQPLIAKVGGSQLKVARAKRISSKRFGFGSRLTATSLTLTAKAATRLDKKLRPKTPFKAGQPIGKLISTPIPRLVTILDQGTATIAFDPAFLAKLESRFVSLNPIFPAEHSGASFSFPVAAGGALSPQGTEGTLRTGGALEFLQLHAGQAFWSELWLDLGARQDTAELDIEPTPAFPGKVGRVGVLDYAATSLSSDPKARTISVAGALTLSAAAAQSFNEAFAQGQGAVFAAGEAVGTLSFVGVGG